MSSSVKDFAPKYAHLAPIVDHYLGFPFGGWSAAAYNPYTIKGKWCEDDNEYTIACPRQLRDLIVELPKAFAELLQENLALKAVVPAVPTENHTRVEHISYTHVIATEWVPGYLKVHMDTGKEWLLDGKHAKDFSLRYKFWACGQSTPKIWSYDDAILEDCTT